MPNELQYRTRFDELIRDGYLVNSSGVVLTGKGSAHFNWLYNEGFVAFRHAPHLSHKGLAVLMACADRPLPHRPRRITIKRG